MIVVIDGPAGSGKSSTAREVARRTEIEFLDSGAIYRTAAVLFLDTNRNMELFIDKLNQSDISFEYIDGIFHTYIDGEEVTDRIRTPEVNEVVSTVAAKPDVRDHVNKLMHEVVEERHFIAEGRDLGTVVFPDAALKFFMVADLETRAKRRYQELVESGEETSLEEVKANLAERDQVDSSRSTAPLVKANDAIEVDTTNMSFEEQVSFITDKVEALLERQD
jgi:cytidylate kinase